MKLSIADMPMGTVFSYQGHDYKRIYAVEKSPLFNLKNPYCVEDIDTGNHTLLEGSLVCTVIYTVPSR